MDSCRAEVSRTGSKCFSKITMDETYYTLIFVKTNKQLLLGFKKRGFGMNTWNGYGGKVERNEDAFDCAIRELHEESNLEVNKKDLNYLGVVVYLDGCAKRIVHIFTTSKTCGDLKETDEMKPKWFHFKNIPYDDMWPDSQFWIPLVLENCWLYASFTYENGAVAHKDVKKLQDAPAVTDVPNLESSPKLPCQQQNWEIVQIGRNQ